MSKKKSKSIATLAKAVKSHPNPEKKGIAKPVEVGQVAAAMILQDDHLKKENLKNRKDLLIARRCLPNWPKNLLKELNLNGKQS